MPKATNAELEARKEQIYIFELLGLPRQLQLSYVREKWGIGKSSLDNYRREVQAQIIKEAEGFKKDALAKSLALRNYLAFEALQQGDLRMVFDIQRDTDKLLGLYEAIKIESKNLNFNVVDFNQFTDEQVRKIASGASIESILENESENGIENTRYLPQTHDDMD